jgi:hypothetical protein
MAEVTWVLVRELAAVAVLVLMLGFWVGVRVRRTPTTGPTHSGRRALHGRMWTVAELREREAAERLRY